LVLPLLAIALSTAQAVLSPPGYNDDDTSPLPLRLEDLEREQEQHQHLDLNRPPLLPNHYEWRPDVAASLPPSYLQDAAHRERERERDLERLQQLEELRQLQRQHQQLSAGYAFPSHLPGVLYVGPTAATPTPTPTTTTTASAAATRFLKPIVPYDLELGLNGVQYVASNALPLPVPRPLPAPNGRPAFVYGFTQGPGQAPGQSAGQSPIQARPPKLVAPFPPPQSKQFAFAPRHYANGPRIPLPYPPSFVSITTRPPPGYRSKPFRPSQPDPTPDLFAGRNSKSLLDSYIPSWEVLRLIREQSSRRGEFNPVQRQTLAYAAPQHLRLYKRDSSRIVKKSLPGEP
ncbi:hypothetical protein KR032_003900, partial [Drosophila birchii]